MCMLSLSRFLFRSSLIAFPHCALACVFNVAHIPLTPLQQSSSSFFSFSSVPIVVEMEVLCFGLSFYNGGKREGK